MQGRPRIVLRGERCAAVARDGTLAGLVQVVEVCLRGVDRVVFFRLLRPADQCGYVVFLGERAVEVQQDLPVEIGVSSDPVVGGGGGASGEYGGRGIGPVCTVVGDHVVGHVVGEAVFGARFGAEHAADLQALDNFEFGIEDAVEVVVVILVVPPPDKSGEFGTATSPFIIVCIEDAVVVHRSEEVVGRVAREVREEESAGRRRFGLGAGVAEVCTDLEPSPFGREVRADVVALSAVIGADVVGLLVEVPGREHVGRVLGTARDADVVVLLEGVLHGLLDERFAVAVDVHVLNLGCGEDGAPAGIGQGFVAQDGVFVRGYMFEEDMGLLGTQLCAEGDGRSGLLVSLLGGDEDDAVRGAGAVDGSGTGILEDVHRFDVVGVEVVHPRGLGLGHAVDNDQRRVVTHGVDASDRDVHLIAARRVVVAVLDDEVCGRTLEGLLDVGDGTVGKVLAVDGRDGRGDVPAGGGTVTDHDDLVEIARILGHGHGDLGFGSDLLHDGFIPEVDELEFVGVLDSLEQIGTVGSGSGTVYGAFDDDGDPDEGLALFVHDFAVYRLGRGLR